MSPPQKHFGKQTLAHASGDDGIERVIDGGVDSVEHGFFVRDDQLAKMRDRQIAWVPTFAPVQEQVDHADQMGWDAQSSPTSEDSRPARGESGEGSRDGRADHRRQRRRLLRRGARPRLALRTGVDGARRTLAAAVINSATGASSNRLAFKEKFGQIKPGFLPRFLLAHHSPLKTVINLSREKTVVFDGEALETSANPNMDGL